jgi:hypothetical protein
LADFTAITQTVNQISINSFSSTDASRIFHEIAANSQNNFPRRFQSVKFSRIAREVHASAAKLFTKSGV